MKQQHAMESVCPPAAAECSHEALPLVVFPRGPSAAADRAAALRGCAERYLPRVGSILFRGFAVHGAAEFRRFVQGFGACVSTPLHAAALGGFAGPGRLWLGCAAEAAETCRTRIADNRELYANLSVALRTRIIERGLRFVLTLGGQAGWRDVFQTEDRAQLEAFCRAHGTRFEWLPQDALRIERKGPRLARHPDTGEPSWIDAGPLLHYAWGQTDAALGGATFEVLYGDGARFEPPLGDGIVEAFSASASRVEWEAGDVLLIDGAMISAQISDRHRDGLCFATETIAGFFRLS